MPSNFFTRNKTRKSSRKPSRSECRLLWKFHEDAGGHGANRDIWKENKSHFGPNCCETSILRCLCFLPSWKKPHTCGGCSSASLFLSFLFFFFFFRRRDAIQKQRAPVVEERCAVLARNDAPSPSIKMLYSLA